MASFSLKQHASCMQFLIDTAKSKNKTRFTASLKYMAGLYDFRNLLWDEEELEFVLEDIFMELSEITLTGKTDEGEVILPGCGIRKADYAGDLKNVEFRIDPLLLPVTSFTLTAPEEEEEDE